MQTVACARGHTWGTSDQETIAMCPVCGGAPTRGVPDTTPVDAREQAIGSLGGPASTDDTTLNLDEAGEPEGVALGAAEEDTEDRTLGLAGEAAPRGGQDYRTIGVSENEQAGAEEHTLGLDDEPRPLQREEQTIGLAAGPDGMVDQTVGADAAPNLGGTGSGGTFVVTPEDDKTGVFTEVPVRPFTMARDPDGTIPGGGEPPGGKAPVVTAKPVLVRRRRDKKDPLAGRTSVAGYEILGELGRGGMGVVYKARQPGANRIVALKMVLNSAHAGGEALARFKIEAEAVAQLQHPNIVQLYAVGEEDGCPFFSLEFVEGESLSKKIENTPQPAREAALLVQRLAEGMYLAHQQGIIHRDLKPANVLLTKDGVPKITDFGLAKRFEDKGEGQTRTGAIMGTPSYMAPEQAQGKTRTTGPAADIYSLGAILYDMLTGRPPFRGSTLLETLQQVQSVEPVPPMRLQPSLPFDLQTICLKALEKDPAKRYQTAGALAEDLRRFAAGEPILARPTPWYERGWKWAKRRPAVASLIAVSILGSISLLILGGLWLDTERRAAETRSKAAEQLAALKEEQVEKETALRKVAEENFQLAQKNSKRAKAAVDQMLSDVGQDRLRNIPRMEPIRRDLLQKAKKFYDEFVQEKSSDPDIRWESALAQQRVADIMVKLGDPKTALKAYDAALGVFQSLEKEHPSLLHKQGLANLADNFGNLLKDIKRNKEAEKNFRQALVLRASLHEQDPAAADLFLAVAKSHNNLANVLVVEGQGKAAEAEYQASCTILRGLAAKTGATPYRAELARTLDNLGTVQKLTGPALLAEKTFDEAGKLLKDLVAREPEVPDHRKELAQNELLLARLFRDTDGKRAEKHYGRSIALRQQLSKDFPDGPEYRQDLASGYSDLAILLQAAGRQKEADDAYNLALEMQQKLVKDFPDVPDCRRNLASSLNNRGIILISSNRAKEGEAALAKALELWSALKADFKDIPEYAMELAGTYLNLGAVRQASQPKSAQDMLRKALALRESLARQNPDISEHQEELARTQGNLGLMLLGHEPEEARSQFRKALAILAKLAHDNPKNPDYRHELAVMRNNLGNGLRALNKPKEAEEEWRQSIALYQDLVREFADVPGYSLELGKRYNELGIFLVSGKRFPDAEQAWKDGIKVQEQLVASSPERPEYRADLGRSMGNLGILFAQAGNVEEAEKQYRRGIALLEEYEPKVAASPALAGYTGELVKIHINLANLMVAVNKPAEAEKSWLRQVELREKLVQAFPESPQFRMEAVGTLNELGNRVVQNQKFAEAKVFYGKAVEHLRALTKEADMPAEMWTNLYLMQLNLATSMVGLKDHAGAAEAVRSLSPKAPPKGRQDHRAAALLARCATVAEADRGLPDAKGKELASSYADQAVALLRQAVANGFRDAEELRQNDDFQALRSRDDFQRILRELQAKK